VAMRSDLSGGMPTQVSLPGSVVTPPLTQDVHGIIAAIKPDLTGTEWFQSLRISNGLNADNTIAGFYGTATDLYLSLHVGLNAQVIWGGGSQPVFVSADDLDSVLLRMDLTNGGFIEGRAVGGKGNQRVHWIPSVCGDVAAGTFVETCPIPTGAPFNGSANNGVVARLPSDQLGDMLTLP
jgi:hypothetical protein